MYKSSGPQIYRVRNLGVQRSNPLMVLMHTQVGDLTAQRLGAVLPPKELYILESEDVAPCLDSDINQCA